MKRCSICHSTYPATFTHCPHDGSLLTAANEWTDGAVIRGKYRILGKLGQGGMATVYKALHIGFDEVRALKVIHAELAGDLSFVKRFGQEAALTRKLQHPNAVRVEDIDQSEDGRPFIVMEFIEGQSLKEVIQQQAPLPVPRVCRIAKQVAGALDAAHQLGIIHRDIKPGNILLMRPSQGGEREETAKVLDFGIAKIREVQLGAGGATLTRTGTSIGTPAYMSPEQAMGTTGSGLDGRADLYSLGVVMYEMLTGELPIKAESEVQMLIGHINTPPQPIRARRPDLPEGIGAVVMRCLEKDPARRPPSGAALIAQIEAAETGMPAAAMAGEMPTVATQRPVSEPAPPVVLPPVVPPPVIPAPKRPRWIWALVLILLGAVAIADRIGRSGSHRRFEDNRRQADQPSVEKPRSLPETEPTTPPAASILTPQDVPPPAPKPASPAVPQPGGELGTNPGDDIQEALKAIPFDRATTKQVKDLWRQASDLMKKGDYEGAAAQYQKLARLRPGWGPAVSALTALAAQSASQGLAAQHSTRTGDLAGAVAHYSVEASLHPDVPGNHYKLGAALGKIGDLDGDMREQQQALRLDPGMGVAHAELASVLARKQSWEYAAHEYREAIRLKPSLAEAHSGLGDALGHTGDWQGEVDEERLAIRRLPNLAIAHFRLGVALEKKGETEGALEEYRRAVDLQPGDADFQANYQRLRASSGK
jgi:serine/threonine protein kinase/Flp pilus assembly protein TadD